MIMNVAHRGARAFAPENTLAAAELAYELGAHMWETDISVTKDGELVLFHNDALTDLSNAEEIFPDRSPWLLKSFTLKELKQLDVGSWFCQKYPHKQITEGNVTEQQLDQYKNLTLPTLNEALALTTRLNWKINIELNPCQLIDLISLL